MFLEKSAETSAKQFSEFSLKWDSTALLSCNLPNLLRFFFFYSDKPKDIKYINKKKTLNKSTMRENYMRSCNCLRESRSRSSIRVLNSLQISFEASLMDSSSISCFVQWCRCGCGWRWKYWWLFSAFGFLLTRQRLI